MGTIAVERRYVQANVTTTCVGASERWGDLGTPVADIYTPGTGHEISDVH
jgi:hypothetical protein